MFWKKKIRTYVNFRNHKIYISNQKLLDKFDYKYFDLHSVPIEDVKRLLYRWLKEKKLFTRYIKDSNSLISSPKEKKTLYSLFEEQKLNDSFWSRIEFAFFSSFN